MDIKTRILKHFLFPVLLASLALVISHLVFESMVEKVAEPNLNNFLFIRWLVYALLSIFISLFLLSKLLDKFLSWKDYASIRFVLQMLSGTALSLLCINLSYRIIKQQLTGAPADLSQIILLNIYGAAFILPIFSSYFGYRFLKAWKKSELESEKLSKENARSQLMSLRNHLDPHFLFNNLNILSSLMDKDIELSKSYLNKFAEVYRVILKTEYSDLTMVEDELDLISSYVYLIGIRFKDCVFFEFDIDKNLYNKALPPLTVQMLVENAIKHNTATVDKPVTIKIYSEGDKLIVSNNNQKKKYLPRERKATGILNIKRRYAFFTDKEVEVIDSDKDFVVILPLIEIEYAD